MTCKCIYHVINEVKIPYKNVTFLIYTGGIEDLIKINFPGGDNFRICPYKNPPTYEIMDLFWVSDSFLDLSRDKFEICLERK